MLEPLIWWLLVELIGVAVLPIAFRLFRHLPDRGYAFIKPLGLLLVAYPFWLLSSFGFLDNTQGAVAVVTVAIGILSWVFWGRSEAHPDAEQIDMAPRVPAASSAQSLSPGLPNGHAAPDGQISAQTQSPIEWLAEHKGPVLWTELVFTIGFALWVFVRSYMPEITATEKPMEFAFLNGILQSRHMPPIDPWLSGYAISYYYFGYVVVAVLTLLSGVASSIAFNLAIGLLFALSATCAFGLAYDLIQGQSPSTHQSTRRSAAYAVLAPIFLLVIGNLEGLFEALHARGLGSASFWQWLDVKGLADAPVTGTFVPTDNWWWWRASRVIHDVARGQTQEVIDEFPQFSFLLGDMHPHVLALPFVLLALAAALNLIRDARLEIRKERWFTVRNRRFGFPFFSLEFLILPVIIGALPFLNFWDILPYGFILIAAFVVARHRLDNAWSSEATRELAFFAAGLGVVSLFLYLPFFVGFQSQAGGLLPVLFVKTQLHQYLLMFGIFVIIFCAFLARLLFENRTVVRAQWTTSALPFAVGVLAFPLLIAFLAVGLITVSPALQESARAAFPEAANNLIANVVTAYFGPLAADPWLAILLAVILVVVLVLLRLGILDLTIPDTSKTFVLLLLLTGFLLTFGVEFVYLRDNFGTRMNTVFKFYFQTWTLFSVCAAFAVFYLAEHLRGIVRWLWAAGLTVLFAASLVYPALGIPNRAEDFARTPTLDGIAWIKSYNPSDYAGIQWLKAHAPQGSHILESTGREYTYDNRMSMATGLPTVLGWAGHEDQWRGGSKLFKNDAAGIDRAADVARIYQTLNSDEVLTLLAKYAIKFVVVGQTERSQYSLTQAQVDKFNKALALVFENGDIRIYARSQ